MTDEELKNEIELQIPEFVKAVTAAIRLGKEMVITTEGSFSEGHFSDEFELFGMAVKYANMKGVAVVTLPKKRAPKTV